MKNNLASPKEMMSSFWRNKELIIALVKREVIGRYRGSVMGILWSFFNPLLLLVIYTFVFSVVFKSRWNTGAGTGAGESGADFAIIIFVGMILHGLFAECINRAPGLIISNVNYVKKVLFPIEILPWVALGSALFHATISISVLMLTQLILTQAIPWTAIFFPIILVPFLFAIMGLSWLLAAFGVYIRDISQMTGMLTTVIFFLSPVVYPVSSLPSEYQSWMQINPLTFIIEEGRNTLIFGKIPDFWQLSVMLGVGILISYTGFACFKKMQKGFSDVL